MEYRVGIKTLTVITVNASSEEQAVKQIEAQLKREDPRNTAEVFIIEESKIS